MIVAHIVLEAKTPLKIGCSEVSFLKDAPIQKDWNGLPMILGTSLTGVIRSFFDEEEASKIFGWQDYKKNDGEGSKVIISNALLLDEHGRVHEEILLKKSSFLENFTDLPLREHTAINHRGSAKNRAKFDEEVVFAGSRFKFSMEFLDEVEWKRVLEVLYNERFRLGAGGTKGFGKVEVIEIRYEEFDEESYVDYESSLNFSLKNSLEMSKKEADKYLLKIKPEDFFIFGSGLSTMEIDKTPLFEDIIDYESKKRIKQQILIPASSIKGAISHRVAYYYNKENKVFAEDISDPEQFTGENNPAVKAIFGHKKENKHGEELGCKGRVLLGDCICKLNGRTKKCDHVKIDRFTGGASEGALFNEEVVTAEDKYEIELVLREDLGEYAKYLEMALKDIVNGILPLGGASAKGHGFFSGKLYKNGEMI